MRSLRFGLLASLLLLTLPAWAQTSALGPQQGTAPTPPAPSAIHRPPWTPHPIRDPQALQVVQASIAALGGAEAIGQVQTCAVQANVTAAPDSMYQSGTILWEISGAESKSVFTSAQQTAAQVSGYGQPFRVINGTAKKSPPHVLRASFFPALISVILLREFQDANYSVQYLGSATIASANATVVRISSQTTMADTIVTPQTWYFDSSTNLPLRVEYRLPLDKDPRKFGVAVVDMSAYQSVSGVLYPFQNSLSIAGNAVNVVTVSSVASNRNIPPTEFAVPTGGLQ